MFVRGSFVLLALVACSDSKNKAVDAPKSIDAAPPTVVGVTCPATPAGTIITTDAVFMYQPTSVSINVGQVVKFTMSATHNVVPDTTDSSDSGLNVDFSATKCLMFTSPGTFHFHCAPHSFEGSVTVN